MPQVRARGAARGVARLSSASLLASTCCLRVLLQLAPRRCVRAHADSTSLRSAYRSEGLRRRIETNTNQPNATIRFVEMDLGELSSIRRAVSEVLDMNIVLKLLVNAAGICAPGKHLKSAEGLDLAYAVDFVGPVLLMQLLHPLLRKVSIRIGGRGCACARVRACVQTRTRIPRLFPCLCVCARAR